MNRKWNRTLPSVMAILLVGLWMWALHVTEIEVPAEFPAGYAYPVLPGTGQWKQLPDHIAKIQACQIPQDVLASMTTPEVLESALDYPLNVDSIVWNSPEAGFLAVVEQSNVYQELLGRPDAAETIVARYSATPAAGKSQAVTAENDEIIRLLEIMLQQDCIRQQLTEAELSAVEQCADEKLEEKKANGDYYGDSPISYYYSVPEYRKLLVESAARNENATVLSPLQGSY